MINAIHEHHRRKMRFDSDPLDRSEAWSLMAPDLPIVYNEPESPVTGDHSTTGWDGADGADGAGRRDNTLLDLKWPRTVSSWLLAILDYPIDTVPMRLQRAVRSAARRDRQGGTTSMMEHRVGRLSHLFNTGCIVGPDTDLPYSASGPFLRVRFRNAREARRRAFLLMARTWDPIGHHFAPVFTAEMRDKILEHHRGVMHGARGGSMVRGDNDAAPPAALMYLPVMASSALSRLVGIDFGWRTVAESIMAAAPPGHTDHSTTTEQGGALWHPGVARADKGPGLAMSMQAPAVDAGQGGAMGNTGNTRAKAFDTLRGSSSARRVPIPPASAGPMNGGRSMVNARNRRVSARAKNDRTAGKREALLGSGGPAGAASGEDDDRRGDHKDKQSSAAGEPFFEELKGMPPASLAAGVQSRLGSMRACSGAVPGSAWGGNSTCVGEMEDRRWLTDTAACLAGSTRHCWVGEMEDGMGTQLDGESCRCCLAAARFRIVDTTRTRGAPAHAHHPLRTQAWSRRCRPTSRTLTCGGQRCRWSKSAFS